MSATAPPGTGRLPAAHDVMAQAGSENFPVAALALGRRHRESLLAIYGYARLVDDVGDEARGDREALLDAIEAQLAGIYAGQTPGHPVMRSLAATIRECRLPEAPFRRLIEANRRDQVKTRYETFAELLDYCALSAAPVGELVLHVFGAGTPERVTLSDRVCAGLQVIEHLQDVAEDYARGRIYLPAEDLARAGCAEHELGARAAGPALRSVIALQAQRSHGLLAAGPPLVRSMTGRARLIVAGFVAGGRATARAIGEADHDVLARRPRWTRVGFAAALLQAVAGR